MAQERQGRKPSMDLFGRRGIPTWYSTERRTYLGTQDAGDLVVHVGEQTRHPNPTCLVIRGKAT